MLPQCPGRRRCCLRQSPMPSSRLWPSASPAPLLGGEAFPCQTQAALAVKRSRPAFALAPFPSCPRGWFLVPQPGLGGKPSQEALLGTLQVFCFSFFSSGFKHTINFYSLTLTAKSVQFVAFCSGFGVHGAVWKALALIPREDCKTSVSLSVQKACLSSSSYCPLDLLRQIVSCDLISLGGFIFYELV